MNDLYLDLGNNEITHCPQIHYSGQYPEAYRFNKKKTTYTNLFTFRDYILVLKHPMINYFQGVSKASSTT